VFTARYGLIPYIKLITFSLSKANALILSKKDTKKIAVCNWLPINAIIYQ